MELDKKNPKNPQEDEVDGLNRVWNESNVRIPGVRVIKITKPTAWLMIRKKATQAFIALVKLTTKKSAIKAYDMFAELWTPIKIFRRV